MKFDTELFDLFCSECLSQFAEKAGVSGKDGQLYCSKSCAEEADFDLCRDVLIKKKLDNE